MGKMYYDNNNKTLSGHINNKVDLRANNITMNEESFHNDRGISSPSGCNSPKCLFILQWSLKIHEVKTDRTLKRKGHTSNIIIRNFNEPLSIINRNKQKHSKDEYTVKWNTVNTP